MIAFRVDANSKIGTGHAMRCLSIAQALRKEKKEVVFITADLEGKQFFENNGFGVYVLNSKWDELDSETDIIIQWICENKCDILIIDSYYVTYDYLKSLSNQVKTVYLDDLFLFKYPVDMVINYNFSNQYKDFSNRYDKKSKLLLGPSYAPLREQFSNVNYEVRKEVKNILITTGGTDQYNITGELLEKHFIKDKYKTIHFHVISGIYNNNYNQLKAYSDKFENVSLYNNIKEMASLMKACDLAISAGGTTLYELCACGLSTICFTFVDNQVEGAEYLDKGHVIMLAGDVRNKLEKVLKNIENYVDNSIRDIGIRRYYSKNMKAIVDGDGSARIANSIILLDK